MCVYGGGDRKAQISNVGAGVEIIIATPGRLNDLVQAGVIDVYTITYLVLDEADRMLVGALKFNYLLSKSVNLTLKNSN